MFPGMEAILPMLLGENAFGGPGGPGGLGDAVPDGGGMFGGMGDKLGALGKVINPTQGQKPIMSGGVSGTSLPFLQQMQDMMTPAMNGAVQRQGSVPQLPGMGQLLAGRQ
jgi:hypothetical protein